MSNLSDSRETANWIASWIENVERPVPGGSTSRDRLVRLAYVRRVLWRAASEQRINLGRFVTRKGAQNPEYRRCVAMLFRAARRLDRIAPR